MICCPLKLRQWRFGCSPEHRMCPMDFVSALMGVRRKRAAAGQLFVSNTVWRRSTRHEASFAQGGSYRLSEDAHLGRLEILSTSVSDGHPEHRSRSVARTQKLSPADIFANSMILSKNVFLLWVHAPRPDCRSRCYKSFIISGMKKQKAPNPKIRGISPDRIYRKMYLQMNNTARMYIRGVIFLCFPQTRLRIT